MTVRELRDYLFTVDEDREVVILQSFEDDLREGLPVKAMVEVKAICGTERKPMLVLIPN